MSGGAAIQWRGLAESTPEEMSTIVRDAVASGADGWLFSREVTLDGDMHAIPKGGRLKVERDGELVAWRRFNADAEPFMGEWRGYENGA